MCKPVQQSLRWRLVLLAFLFVTPGRVSADMIQLDAARDNTIFEEMVGTNHLSNGAGDFLFAGSTDLDNTRRALMVFDVSANIPAGATITSASLRMNVTRRPTTSPHLHTIHRLESDWGEGASDALGQEGAGISAQPGDATWQHAFFDPASPTPWSSPGGDFAGPLSSSVIISDELTEFVFFPSTPQTVGDVQFWLDNPGQDFGWILLGEEGFPTTATRFSSRNDEDGPVLFVEFTPIPEPSSLLLLALGGAGTLIRKRSRRDQK